MNISIRNAKASDARAIVPLLRDRDRDGLASLGDPTTVILEALQCSIASFTATADGDVAVMWGLRSANLLSDHAYLWMLGTRVAEENPIHFLRHSRAAVTALRDRYALLYGECAVDFERSARWLTWLGAKISAPEPGGRLVFAIPGDDYGA